MFAAKPIWVLTILLTSTSLAADGLSPTYQKCIDRSAGVTLHMQQCLKAETDQHDARLNENYQTAMHTLAAPQQLKLRDAQRAWLNFRDAECGFINTLTGGSIDRINSANCMLEMTQIRADALADLLKLYLGD